MIWVELDYSDGSHYMREIPEDKAKALKAQGHTGIITVQDSVWSAYCRFCEDNAVWEALMLAWSNAAYDAAEAEKARSPSP